jgi:hypothetical protein
VGAGAGLREVEFKVSVLLVVLIVWALVAFVALALARTLCAVAARADAEHAAEQRRPVAAPRFTASSTSPEPRRHVRARVLARR